MKLLIALALVTAASADQVRVAMPEVPSPMFTRPSMGQVIVPFHINEAIKVVNTPVMRNAEDDGLKVRFVDAPLAAPSDSVVVVQPEVPASDSAVVVESKEFSVPQPVKLGKAPAPAFETAEANAVKFVDAPMVEPVRIALPEASAAEEISPIKIADLPAVETFDAVKFADAPLDIAVPEPIKIAEAPLPAVETVEPVKIAVPGFRDYRGKVFADPMWR